MDQKPAEPTPWEALGGISSAGKVVRIVVGTAVPGVRLKNEPLMAWGEVKSVTWRVT